MTAGGVGNADRRRRDGQRGQRSAVYWRRTRLK